MMGIGLDMGHSEKSHPPVRLTVLRGQWAGQHVVTRSVKLRQGEAQGDRGGDVRAGPSHLSESGKTSVMNEV